MVDSHKVTRSPKTEAKFGMAPPQSDGMPKLLRDSKASGKSEHRGKGTACHAPGKSQRRRRNAMAPAECSMLVANIGDSSAGCSKIGCTTHTILQRAFSRAAGFFSVFWPEV